MIASATAARVSSANPWNDQPGPALTCIAANTRMNAVTARHVAPNQHNPERVVFASIPKKRFFE